MSVILGKISPQGRVIVVYIKLDRSYRVVVLSINECVVSAILPPVPIFYYQLGLVQFVCWSRLLI